MTSRLSAGARKRSPSASAEHSDCEPPTKRTRTSFTPSRSPSPPLFVVTASPSLIVDDSHYASFGLGFSYDYAPTSPTATSLSILGERSLPTVKADTNREGGPGSLLNHLFPSKQCFNCQSPHHTLSNCPFRHDPFTISQNRERFQQTSSPASYHRLSDPRNNPSLASNEYASQRQRFLSYHARFRPGHVSDELRSALGFERDGRGYQTEELPWLGRIATEGYPSGWTWRDTEGEVDPASKSREVIERRREGELDWEFGEVDMLEVYDDADEATLDDRVNQEVVQRLGGGGAPVNVGTGARLGEPGQSTATQVLPPPVSPPPPPPPPDPPPPLPSDPPPPLPPGPPPPLPPSSLSTARILRQADYKTCLFDSRSHFLSFSAQRWYEGLNRDAPARVQDGGRDEGAGEEEMDFGGDSSDDD
ncbi:hypothetical protein JCM11491_003388 [Sporobolomyces phaffii]